jgi:hypothetical protein
VLASQVAGARVWMNVADRLYQLPMSLVGVAIGVALLPRLSKALQTEDHDDAQAAMDQAMVFALAFSLPAAAALMAMPVYLIDGLFTRGAFLPTDAGPDRIPALPLRLGRAGLRAAAHPAAGLLRALGHQDADAFFADLGGGQHRARRDPVPHHRHLRASPRRPASPPG